MKAGGVRTPGPVDPAHTAVPVRGVTWRPESIYSIKSRKAVLTVLPRETKAVLQRK